LVELQTWEQRTRSQHKPVGQSSLLFTDYARLRIGVPKRARTDNRTPHTEEPFNGSQEEDREEGLEEEDRREEEALVLLWVRGKQSGTP
jgi:hypothetical protein